MTETRPDAPPVQVLAASPRRQAPPPGPRAMVIFGASGDLTRRLLVPALYNLARTGLIPAHFAIIGVDIAERSAEGWSGSLREMLQSFVGNPNSENRIDAIDDAMWQRLTDGVSYVQGDFGDRGLFEKLRLHLQDVARERQSGRNCLFYLAVADRFFGPIVEQLGHAGLLDEELRDGKAEHWRRVVIEKPFGHSVDSARELNTRITRELREEQIFRIDHFLGKETVQNIMAFRFANGLFEPIWNRDRIDHVQITVAETVGVEHRGRFYEVTGACATWCRTTFFLMIAMSRPFTPRSHPNEFRRNPLARCCAASTVRDRRCGAIARSRMWRTIPIPRPSWRCGWGSTTGAGPACRSIYASASECRVATARSPSGSNMHPMRRSRTLMWSSYRRTGWCCASSPTKEYHCSSR